MSIRAAAAVELRLRPPPRPAQRGMSNHGEDQSMKIMALAIAALTFTAASLVPADGQQTTGVPGSPSATTTIPGNQLPAPDPKFGGVIEEAARDSTPYWPPRIVPPKGAPNVLLIMTDDQGYGVTSTFGGVIPTPAMDRIAKAGLRYTASHRRIPRSSKSCKHSSRR